MTHTLSNLKKQSIDPVFKYGFEIEGCIEEEFRADLIDYVCALYPEVGANYLIHYDGSIRPKATAIEIVTPPIYEADAIERFEWLLSMLNILTEEGLFVTNRTCGLHINISEVNSFHHRTNVKRNKLVFEFMNRIEPNKWRRKFGRHRNKYCWWNGAPSNISDIMLETHCYNQANKYYIGLAHARHWMAINPTHINHPEPNNRRLEIRIVGGKDYHLKTDLLSDFFVDLQASLGNAYSTI